jgi:hypothetical protein
MREIACQIKEKSLHPFSEEDLEILREYKPNQILRVKLQGVKKPRSYLQLKLYWSGCKLVSDNTEDVHWNTKEKVDFQCRVHTHFVDPDCVVVKKDGTVAFSYRSIAFANLKHIEACNYFDQAFRVMAKFLMVPVDTLMEQIINQ